MGSDMDINVPITVCLIGYALLMLAVSLYWMTKIKKATDLLMGGRKLPFWALTGTFTATGVGTGVAVGAVGLAYSSGWAGCAYPIGLGVGVILVGLFFSKLRRYRLMTLSEEIACYYGGHRILYEFSNLCLFISQPLWLTVQIMGGGAVLSVVLGLDINTCMVIAGVLIAITSIPGGLLTVVYTDVVQALILIVGFASLTFVALSQSDGLGGLQARVPPENFSLLGHEAIGWWGVVSVMLATVIAGVADPGRRLMMYGARSEKGARWSMYTAGVVEIIFSVAVGIVGMYAFSRNPDITEPDQVLPLLVQESLPLWLAALVLVSVTAAVFSSGDSNAAAAGTYFVRHIFPLITGRYPKNPLRTVRWALAVTFVISTGLALVAGNIVDFVVAFLSVTMSGLAIVIVLGRFWKRATWQGGVAALATASVVSLIVIFVPSQKEFWVKPIIPATLGGLIAEIVVSLLTPPNNRSFEEIVEVMAKQRQQLDDE